MNNIEYVYEGHDLTKEVVMVQTKDNQDAPWSVPKRLCMIRKYVPFPYVAVHDDLSVAAYKYARLAKRSIKPWTLETAPRYLEVELEKNLFYTAIVKGKELATFQKEGERYHLTWKQLTAYKQWDGTPCGEVVE